MNNRVLVGVGPNDEERAEAVVRTVSRLVAGDGTAVLAHVYAEADSAQLREMLDIDPAEPEQMNTAVQHNTAVQAVADGLEEAGIEPEFRGEFGDADAVLVDLVDREDADFLVVGGRKRSPTGKAIFGSTAQRLLLAASCPVVFVKAPSD